MVPSGSLEYWEGECAFWLSPAVNAVVYAGPAAARSVLLEHELWLSPSALDDRSMRPRGEGGSKARAM